MGAKHSKPRMRRNRRFSSLRKRQAPEGSNDPTPTPSEARACGNNRGFDAKSGMNGGCKYCGASDDCCNLTKQPLSSNSCSDDIKRDLEATNSTSFFSTYLDQTELKVDLPKSPACCRSCVAEDKSKNLPPRAGLHDSNKVPDKEDEQEWTITLYEIDKMSGRVPREEMVRLMSSIYEAVDAKVGESPQGRKTLRLRLSVTPEGRTQTKVNRTSSTPPQEHSQRRCANCPDTEPARRRGTSGEHRIRRHESDASPTRLQSRQNSATRRTRPSSGHRRPSRDNSGDNNDRAKHYAKLEGLDNTMYLHKKEHNGVASNLKKGRSKSLPQNRHRTWPKLEEFQNKPNGTKHRQRQTLGDHRTAMLKTRRKDPRFASPYDQHFQEAMYLRLRELQRQGAFEMRRATGRGQDSDDADDDSESDLEVAKSKSDSDEKSIEQSTQQDLSTEGKLHEIASARIATKQSSSDKIETSVHHHHHYHHRLPDNTILAALPTPIAEVKCVAKAADLSCSSVVQKTDDKPTGQHHHHYHHHYHHVDES